MFVNPSGLVIELMDTWNVCILRCSDGSLYTGIARDVARRVAEHNSDKALAAKYTRARRPVRLVYQETWESRSKVCQREYVIKQMDKKEKKALIAVEGV